MTLNNICGGRALRIAFETAVLVLLFASGASALSNDGGGSWQYYHDITINNPSAALTDYQILVSLTGADFPTNANQSGADIRFTDTDGVELSYWIENWDYSSKNAKIWVKIPSIPANAETNIQMYYGNPSAISSSDGTRTFDLFDNFDTLTWTPILEGVNTGSPTVSNSILSLPDGQFTRVSKDFDDSQNYVYTYKMRYVGNLDYYNWYMFNFKNYPPINSNMYGTGYNVGGYVESGAVPNEVYIWRSDYGGRADVSWLNNLAITDKSLSRNIWYVWKVIYNNGEISVLVDDIPAGSAIDTTYTTGSILAFQTGKDIGVDIDYIYVRKYASPEPSVSVRAEQMQVAIDIKPGSFPNSINLGSEGNIPVAILSSATFDTRTVNASTVTLARAMIKLRGKGTPIVNIEDVNGDGLLDMVVHVNTEALQLSATDTEANLEGKTVGGTLIIGIDSVRIVPP